MRTASCCYVRQMANGQWKAEDTHGHIHATGGRRKCKRVAKGLSSQNCDIRERKEISKLSGALSKFGIGSMILTPAQLGLTPEKMKPLSEALIKTSTTSRQSLADLNGTPEARTRLLLHVT